MSTMLSSLQTVFKIIELSFAWSIKLVNSKKKKKKCFMLQMFLALKTLFRFRISGFCGFYRTVMAFCSVFYPLKSIYQSPLFSSCWLRALH